MWNSAVLETVDELREKLQSYPSGTQVGLVPTMGALHHGHGSLVSRSLQENNVTVVSVFVNPKQFNNPDDLKKYPRTLEKDIDLLNQLGEVIVFAPSVEEMYNEEYTDVCIDLGELANVMEGVNRPGHFEGVLNVVNRLFEIVQPNKAYFGLKDFQQVAVIHALVKGTQSSVEVVECEIIREESGLASSSRNLRLTEKQKEDAVLIIQALRVAKFFAGQMSVQEVQDIIEKRFKDSPLELEYFTIVHPRTLQPINEWLPGAHACVVACAGEVRLLDNLQLLPLK